MPGISITQRIRRARIGAGLTQAELGEKIGLTQSSVTALERGKISFLNHLDKLEEVLGPIKNKKKFSSSEIEGEERHDSDEGSLDDTPVSPVGIWVREARARARLTPAELAVRAGISYQTVLSLENGRIQNPQKNTLNKLQKTLSEKLPGEVVREVAKDASISGDIGNLTDFDPHDEKDWPEEPGVYVLYDVSQRPIYVGKSNIIRRRLKEHEDKFWFKRPIVEYGSYVCVKDEGLRHQLEQVLIKFLKSNAVINVKSTER